VGQGLTQGGARSPRPSEAGEAEGDATAATAVGSCEAKEAGVQAAAGVPAEQPLAGRSRPGSRAGGGSEAGSGSALSRPASEHSSLALQLPGGQAAVAEPLAAVPEESSQRCLHSFPSRRDSRQAGAGLQGSSQLGSPAGSSSPARLLRGRSLEAAQRRTDASPKAGDSSRRLAKAASSKTFSISARAEGTAKSPARRSQA